MAAHASEIWRLSSLIFLTSLTLSASAQPPGNPVRLAAAANVQPAPAPVHVFLLHGLDPFDWAGLCELRDYIAGLGVSSARLYEFFEVSSVQQDIAGEKARHPEARIIVIGFSAGALSARRLVGALHEQHGIDVEVLVYLGGGFVDDSEYSRPPYVGEVIHILADTPLFRGGPITEADNYRILGIGHFDSPSHPLTWGIISQRVRALSEPVEPERPAPTETTRKASAPPILESASWQTSAAGAASLPKPSRPQMPTSQRARLMPPRPGGSTQKVDP